jgi:hypothetical protein
MSGITSHARAVAESGSGSRCGARSDTGSGVESARTGTGPSDGQAGMSTSLPSSIRLFIV